MVKKECQEITALEINKLLKNARYRLHHEVRPHRSNKIQRKSHWTQSDVADEVGITPDYYAKIERGVANKGKTSKKVSLEVLHDISGILRLSDEEKHSLYCYYSQGYLKIFNSTSDLQSFLPPLSKITRMLDLVAEELDSLIYPAYITDYRFRYWLVNPATAHLVGGISRLQGIAEMRATIFDIVFDSRFSHWVVFADHSAIMRNQLIRFMLNNKRRAHEEWYQAYPDCMGAIFSKDDFQRFKEIWNGVKTMIDNDEHASYLDKNQPYWNRVTIEIEGETIDFVLTENRSYFLDEMFDTIRYVPVETPENIERAKKIFEKRYTGKCIKIWEKQGFIDALKNELQ
jgi:transcriptional regulator with XRE-family HTH domain